MLKQKPTLTNSMIFIVFMAALIVFVYHFNIPNPNMILIAALVLSTAIGGTVPGVICAVLMLGYSFFFFSTGHSFFQFTEINLHKIIVISLGVVINFFSVAILKRNRDRAGSQLKMTNEELMNTNSQLAQTNEELKKVNELLKAMASKDSLTNLRNRYALRQDFEMYVGIPLYIAFLDLDEFKLTNDTKGHAFGDKILATVGKALANSFRTCNCYRYGGDEFLIVGENVTKEEFNDSYQQAKETLDASEIRFSGGYVHGVPETIPELRSMIMQADEMLYAAKESGRNRFIGGAFDRDNVPTQEAVARHKSHHEVRKS